jgi:probable Rubsico expression protein CbbX
VNEDEAPPDRPPGPISDYLSRVERERAELRNEQREQLSREGAVDIDEAFRLSHLGEVLAKLDRELVGLVPVKARVREIAHVLLANSMRGKVGLVAERPNLHMSFTGRPGTGKTTVALRMAEILYRLGYVRKGHLVSANRDDLVSQYPGHSELKTREVIKRAMGGVLFIDDAYDLYKVEGDFGAESLNVLLRVMADNHEDVAVIFSGDAERMAHFFKSGLGERVGHHINFQDYSADELLAIAHTMLVRLNYEFTPAGEGAFREYLSLRLQQPQFANARSVRNALDRARLRQATRLFEQKATLKPHDLRLIDESDIRKSWVFLKA